MRSLTIGRPYSVTCSVATARPAFGSHRMFSYDRFTRWAPTCSAHFGSIFATRRAYSWFVSTSSAAITHGGGRRVSTEPGAITNRDCRAPTNSRVSRSRMPMCDSSPASTAWWT